MSSDTQFFIASTIIALLLAVPTFLGAKYVWRNRQSQKVDRGGIGYQAGGDIKVDHKP